MDSNNRSQRDARLAAEERRQERAYWQEILAGDWNPAQFPREPVSVSATTSEQTLEFPLEGTIAEPLIAFCGGSDITIHVFLTAAMHGVLGALDWRESVDNAVLTPISRQEAGTPLINTVLPIRCRFEKSATFKELLLAARDAVADGDEHLNFPLLETFPRIREIGVAVLLEQIHDVGDLEPLKPSMVWSFCRRGQSLACGLSYDGGRFGQETVRRLASRFAALIRQALANVEAPLLARAAAFLYGIDYVFCQTV